MDSSWQSSGIITLTTDFGLHDPFVGVMKGVILARYPQAKMVDFTHSITPYWPIEAGFWLSRCFAYLPQGTVHVAVVDPGVGTSRKILIVEAVGHRFLAPDNGLLTPLLRRCPEARCYALDAEGLGSLGLPPASATFHGRDIFAPLAAELSLGRCRPTDFGTRGEPVQAQSCEPLVTEQTVNGAVMTIDHFGNLITNIDRAHLARFPLPVISAAGRQFSLTRTYGQAHPGDYVALVNAFDVIEIARVQGDAAAGLNLPRGAPVVLSNQSSDRRG